MRFEARAHVLIVGEAGLQVFVFLKQVRHAVGRTCFYIFFFLPHYILSHLRTNKKGRKLRLCALATKAISADVFARINKSANPAKPLGSRGT